MVRKHVFLKYKSLPELKEIIRQEVLSGGMQT